ncbi:hypothetical protein D9M68_558950 [compost metagenome]
MTIRSSADAVAQGDIIEIPLPGKQRVYAYIRYSAKQRLLVIANFDRQQAFQQDIELPAALLNVKSADEVTELLSGQKPAIRQVKIAVNIQPATAQIIQF